MFYRPTLELFKMAMSLAFLSVSILLLLPLTLGSETEIAIVKSISDVSRTYKYKDFFEKTNLISTDLKVST